jgi:hypothetical protein
MTLHAISNNKDTMASSRVPEAAAEAVAWSRTTASSSTRSPRWPLRELSWFLGLTWHWWAQQVEAMARLEVRRCGRDP